jgi:hypothetical protein
MLLSMSPMCLAVRIAVVLLKSSELIGSQQQGG